MPQPKPFPAHVQWLLPNRGAALRTVLDAQGIDLDIMSALHVLVDADPSPGAHAVQWLCDGLIAGTMRWEDVAAGQHSRARTTLELFAQHRRTLDAGNRNLESHAGLGALHRVLAPLAGQSMVEDIQPGSRELRRRVRAQAYHNSLVLHQSPELIVAVPLSVGASRWWGRGTQWCTAADKDNAFETYHPDAPLIVVVMPGVEEGKLQLHMPHDDCIQFMDVHDEPVDPGFIARHWSRLGGFMQWALARDARMLEYMPPLVLTPRMCLLAVQGRGVNLANIPYRMRTSAVCRAAVLNDSRALEFVPLARQSAILVEAYVRAHPQNFSTIPLPYRTPELSRMAVELDGRAISGVPTHLVDRSMLEAALCTWAGALTMVSMRQRTAEMCRAAVVMDGRMLEFVPIRLRTPELCRLAVEQSGLALEWVPKGLRNAGMCEIAVRKTTYALPHVPVQLRTVQMCLDAVESDNNLMPYVPDDMRTPRMLLDLVERNAMALRYIHGSARTQELKLAALRKNIRIYWHLNHNELNCEICTLAVSLNPIILRFVPVSMQTSQMCLEAVRQRPYLMSFVQYEHRSFELYVQACSHSESFETFVPPELREKVIAAVEERARNRGPGEDLDRVVECGWNARECFDGLDGALTEYAQAVAERSAQTLTSAQTRLPCAPMPG